MPASFLLIDDDQTTNLLNKTIIEKSKHEIDVRVISDPLEIAGLLENSQLKLDDTVILLDINMPDLNGWEVAEQFINFGISESTKIYMLTSSVDPADEVRARKTDGIEALYSKPLTFEMVDELVVRHF